MSIQKSKFIGKFINPETGRKIGLFQGTDSIHGFAIRHYEKNGKVFRIPPGDWLKWKKCKEPA